VGGVDIAAEDNAAPRLDDEVDTIEEGAIEVELVRQALRTGLAVGEVDVLEADVADVGDDYAPFIVEFGSGELGAPGRGRLEAVRGHAGVAFPA